jgi:hypothetical protein
MQKAKEKGHSVGNVIIAASQAIQPNFAQNQRSSIMSVTIAVKSVTRQLTAEPPRAQEKEVKREERGMVYMK